MRQVNKRYEELKKRHLNVGEEVTRIVEEQESEFARNEASLRVGEQLFFLLLQCSERDRSAERSEEM